MTSLPCLCRDLGSRRSSNVGKQLGTGERANVVTILLEVGLQVSQPALPSKMLSKFFHIKKFQRNSK